MVVKLAGGLLLRLCLGAKAVFFLAQRKARDERETVEMARINRFYFYHISTIF
jgi:hypothetical protein